MDNGVDILIPYHGQYKLVRELIGSIFLYTRNIPFRITIIDDGSPNAAYFATLAQLDSIDGVRSEECKGLGAAINLGLKATKRPWVVILNSDCLIDEVGWLRDLHNSLVSMMHDKVGFVSARSNNPPGTHPLLKCNKETRKGIEDQVSDQALPLFCCMMPRLLFDRVGVFKEYPYGWYEDEEFFWRMKKHGYKQAISGKAWVRHLGEDGIGATVKEFWAQDPTIKSIMENNRLNCLSDLKKMFGK